MKKIPYIIIFLLLFSFDVQGQTYIQGNSVLPFSDAAESKYSPPSERLSTEESYEKLKSIYPESLQKSPEGMTGEFWLVDGMLIQVVTRYTTAYKDTMSLDAIMYSSRPPIFWGSILNGVKQPVDSRQRDDYYDELKSVNGFDVLIQYLRTLSHTKRFEIRDSNRKYIIRGTIYAKKEDFDKAHRFIDTLLESITFKE